MGEFKGTKGNWEIEDNMKGLIWIWSEDVHVAEAIYNKVDMDIEEAKANAQLIASAPKMLLTLQRIERFMKSEFRGLGNDTVGKCRLQEVTDVINKALGN